MQVTGTIAARRRSVNESLHPGLALTAAAQWAKMGLRNDRKGAA